VSLFDLHSVDRRKGKTRRFHRQRTFLQSGTDHPSTLGFGLLLQPNRVSHSPGIEHALNVAAELPHVRPLQRK
jgi:hypothetical protein